MLILKYFKITNCDNLQNVITNVKRQLHRQTLKRFFILTLFLFSCLVYGQNNVTTKARKFFIGANFSPDYCYRVLTQNDNNISNNSWTRAKNILDSIEIAKFGYTAGIVLGYQFNVLIGIETGIQFSNKGYKTLPILTIYDLSKPGAIAQILFHTLS